MTQDKLQRIEAFIAQYGIDPLAIYCQATGAVIGYYDDDQFHDSIDYQLSQGADLEESFDDYAVRLLAGLRPSSRWIKISQDYIRHMRDAKPIETLAYFMNRRFHSLRSHRADYSQLMLARIENHEVLQAVFSDESNAEALNDILYLVLHVDSFVPANWEGIDQFADTVEYANHNITAQELLEQVTEWHDSVIAYYTKLKKQPTEGIDKRGNLARYDTFLERHARLTEQEKSAANYRRNRELYGDIADLLEQKTEADLSEFTVVPESPKPSTTKMPAWGKK